MQAKYSPSTKGIYITSVHQSIPNDALDIPDAIYMQYKNAEIQALKVQAGKVVADIPAPPPPKTLQEQFEDVRFALQSAIDAKANTFDFSSGNALMLYAGFVNPFQILAQTFASWEASVWVEAEAYKVQVIAGTKPMLTPEQAVALMPVYPA